MYYSHEEATFQNADFLFYNRIYVLTSSSP